MAMPDTLSDAGSIERCAPIAQGIERLPPEQKAAGSNPVRGTNANLTRTCESHA
jgi:hypothetical protein